MHRLDLDLRSLLLNHRGMALAAPALCVCALWGCVAYERAPLDPGAARTAWLARSPGDQSVREYAERLASAEGARGAFNPGDGLTLAEAEVVALVFNRDLRVARLAARVTEATAANAGLWDDPVVGVDVERILKSVPEPWIVAGVVGITLPISGRLEAEKARAGAAYAAELERIASEEWRTRTVVRERWVEWSAAGARVALAEEYVASVREVSDLAVLQEEAGSLSRIEAGVFRVELAGREADGLAARARVKAAEIALRDVLGLSPGAAVEFVPAVVFEPREVDEGGIRAAMEAANPELAALRAEYEVAEESLREQVRGQYPDLTVGPGYKSEDGDPRVLLGLSLPVPLWNRNKQGVAEALAARDVARARVEAGYERLDVRLAAEMERFRAAREVRGAVEQRVAPLADAQYADVRRSAELGRVDPLLIREAIASRQETKARLVDAREAEALAGIGLDGLMGPRTAAGTEGGER